MVSAASVLGVATRNRAHAGTPFVNITVPAVLAVVVLTVMSSGWAGLEGSSLPTTAGTKVLASRSTGIQILPLSSATPISPEFWGIDVEPTLPFNVSDAHELATTPVTYIKYPGGETADEMNYTSGIITNATGAVGHAATPTGNFTKSCEAIRCHAILDLPAETDRPATAAYYVSYVEHTLGFTPSYWEIGNTPSAWNHYDQPWSTWATAPTSKATIPEYTALLLNFTAAIRTVDPTTPLMAPAIGQGTSSGIPTCYTWCGPVVASDGANLSAVSVHSYVASLVPADTSVPSYFSRLTTSLYAFPTVIPKYRAIIAHNFSGSLPLVLDEVGVVNHFSGNQQAFGNYTKGLYGGLFVASEVTQLLALDVANVEWFDWASSAGYGWYGSGDGPWSPIGQVFQTFMTQLYGEYDPTTVVGASTLYAAATTDGTNLSLLVVNVNTTKSFSFPLSTLFSGTVNETSWAYGSNITTAKFANTTGTALPVSVSVWRGHGYGSPPKSYSVTFSESGLPSGETFQVTVGSVTKSLTADGATDGLTWTGLSDGTYAYSITDISGWHQSSIPYTGTEVVNGLPVSVSMAYTQVTYAVTFTESGLPTGTNWSVTANSAVKHSLGTTIVFAEPNGSVSYSIGAVPAYIATPPTSGTVTVASGPQNVAVAFTPAPVDYTIAFVETGLPTGTSWSVTLGGTLRTSTTAMITFAEPNGNYTFAVDPVSGYATVPPAGNVHVNGSTVGVAIGFNSLPPGTYAVTFAESGLPSGTLWSVTLNGSSMSSATAYVVFTEPSWTYSFTVGSLTGYTVSPSTGSITVKGAPVSLSITFTTSSTPPKNGRAPATFLGLPPVEGYSLLGVIVAAAVVAAAAVVLYRRGAKRPSTPEMPPEQLGEDGPPTRP